MESSPKVGNFLMHQVILDRRSIATRADGNSRQPLSLQLLRGKELPLAPAKAKTNNFGGCHMSGSKCDYMTCTTQAWNTVTMHPKVQAALVFFVAAKGLLVTFCHPLPNALEKRPKPLRAAQKPKVQPLIGRFQVISLTET